MDINCVMYLAGKNPSKWTFMLPATRALLYKDPPLMWQINCSSQAILHNSTLNKNEMYSCVLVGLRGCILTGADL